MGSVVSLFIKLMYQYSLRPASITEHPVFPTGLAASAGIYYHESYTFPEVAVTPMLLFSPWILAARRARRARLRKGDARSVRSRVDVGKLRWWVSSPPPFSWAAREN